MALTATLTRLTLASVIERLALADPTIHVVLLISRSLRVRSKWGRRWRTSGTFIQVYVCNWNAIEVSFGDI